ncbi:hypothetical protein ONA24_03405 [Mycoplasmopsis cynos]|uniref:Mbov_0396 family ICE element transmembrane protein n=1 Tax=Mycoplasmopsis cynos TaxID=171284 RepID=UPI0024C94A73|nr:hypothetical protein [Mycoplasmopsis cynos]WAM10283.1 hypothetical protein ONA24_03405 [Mycoplasmopsis cynos]
MFGWLIGKILQPITNLIVKWSIGYLFFVVITAIVMLCLIIVSLIIKMIYLFSYEFPNYLLFGGILNYEGSTSQLLNLGNVWYQFLIVSLVVWALMLCLTIIRFTIAGSERAHNIMKTAVITATKGIGLLFIIQGAMFAFNFVILKITGLLIGNSDYSGLFVNNFLIALYANSDLNIIEISKGINNLSYSELGKWFTPEIFSSYYDKVAAGVFGLLVGGILGVVLMVTIVKIMFNVIYDVISKLFHMMILFLFFPIIVPWSLNDGGKKIQIWKDEYIADLLSLSVYLIGLKLMFIFIIIANGFISNYFVGNYNQYGETIGKNIIKDGVNSFKQISNGDYSAILDFNDGSGGALNEANLSGFRNLIKDNAEIPFYLFIALTMRIIFMTGAVVAYKNISSYVIKYIGTELNTGLGNNAYNSFIPSKQRFANAAKAKNEYLGEAAQQKRLAKIEKKGARIESKKGSEAAQKYVNKKLDGGKVSSLTKSFGATGVGLATSVVLGFLSKDRK